MLLIEGAPNQVVDLWRARLDPLEMLMELNKVQKSESRVQAAIESGVGACGEHARITFSLLASAQTNQPVFRVSAIGVDHGFSIIGDHRELPLDRVVIVDAWPTFPRTHTADVGMFEIGITRETALAAADPKYFLDDAKLLENRKIDFSGTPPVGRLHEISNVRKKFMQLFSIKDEHRGLDYTLDGVSGRFDQLPGSYVYDRMSHHTNYMDAVRPS